jgi:heme/copper-type cytochrome/quinol oxidase subunit 2
VSITGSPANPAQMALPVGEPIKLILVSKDVIHSFYVPAFLVKRDVVPLPEGKSPNELEFTVSEAGTYAGQCAEFCGDLHARMTFSVLAMSREKFDGWIAAIQAGATPGPSVAAEGPALEIGAKDIAFSTKALEATAGQPFTIEFTNDDATPHNVAIWQDNQELFTGEIITGPNKTVTYAVEALPPGEYTFICDVHPIPAMTGKLTIK